MYIYMHDLIECMYKYVYVYIFMYIHEVISAPDSRASFCLLILLFVKLALEDDLPADHGQFWGSTLNLGELYVFHYMYGYICIYMYIYIHIYRCIYTDVYVYTFELNITAF